MPTTAILAVGSRFGPFRIDSVLGRGGMGVVYRAEQLRLRRPVALKLLPAELAADDRYRERFLREARLAAAIEHPGIVPVYDAGELDGLLYIAMRYVDGRDLASVLRAEGPLEASRAVAIVAQLARALDAANARGLVHRDVKPSNALVSGEQVYLVDFGIARDATEGPRLTQTDELPGTVDYLAPERIRGEDADAGADVYSLGCVLFECLTGELPFPRPSTAAMLFAHLEDEPPRVSERRSGVPHELDSVISRALAKDPAARWGSCGELALVAAAALRRQGLADSVHARVEPDPELRRREDKTLRHELAPAPPLSPRAGIPVPPTPTIGRGRDLAAAAARLRDESTRLLTLVGPGGVGKTRLALEVARALSIELPDGALFVGLAATARPEHVAGAIAQALAVAPRPAESFVAALARELAPQHLLLVLDNFEHVVDAAPVVRDLLVAAPGVRMLVTSRRPLRLAGEQILAVSPLGASDAGALFEQRARAAGHAGGFGADQAPAVRDLCARLDGLPLAIELAAARAGVLSPRELVRRLDARFERLGPHARDAPERQRTLWATLEWSYALLGDTERRLLARLSVFHGGCDVDAAEAVYGAGDVVEALAALVEHSLVGSATGSGGDTRFAMLDTIRAYAAERLAQSGEADDARREHAEHFTVFAERLEPEVGSARDATALDRLEADHDNLRAALDWAVAAGHGELALRLVAALGLFWHFRGHLDEAVARLDAALASGAQAQPARIKALRWRAVLLANRGDHDAAHADAQELLAFAAGAEDPVLRIQLLEAASFVASQGGDLVRSRELKEQVLARSRAAGARLWLSIALNGLADIALREGRFEDAAELSAENVAMARADGSLERTAVALGNLASALLELGRHGDAARGFVEALELSRRLGLPAGIAYALEGLAAAAAALDRHETAARLEGVVQAALERAGMPLQAYEADRRQTVLTHTRAALGSEAFTAAVADGRSLSLEDAMTVVAKLADPATDSRMDGQQ